MGWRLACPDWKERLRARRSLVPDLPLFPAAREGELAPGDRAVAVFNKLRLADVPGTPTLEEAGGDWFRDIVRALLGSLDPVTRQRMIRELFLLVPKKNMKTTGGGLLMLTALLLNERPRAPFALMAPVQDTAEEAYEAVAGAIALDPVLEKKLHVRDHKKTIVHRETKADLQIVTFDPDLLTGKKFVGALIDELHVIAKNAKAAKAIRQVRGGMIPFPEAFLAFITTMPDEEPVGVMKAELKKARDIRDGVEEGAMLPVLYEFPEEMQREKTVWMDRSNWPMVTPNLGRSVTMERLIELYEDASKKGDDELRGWASQHLNLQIGLGLRTDSWAGAEFWEAQALDGGLTLEEFIARCEVIVAGADGGGLDDLLGLTLVGRERGTGDWLAWSKAWAHKIVLERRKEIAQKLLDLQLAGELVIIEDLTRAEDANNGPDIEELADIIEQINDRGLFPEKNAIGVDPAGVGGIVNALVGRGLTPGPEGQIVGISQGWKLAGAIKTTERKLAEGGLWHGGALLMNWCVGNAKVETRSNGYIVTKQASGTAKIDPLMALYNGVSLMSLNPVAHSKKPQLLFI